MVRLKKSYNPVIYRYFGIYRESYQNHNPSYRLHKPSGQAVATFNGQDIYLDRPE